jgi:hypothetical protein
MILVARPAKLPKALARGAGLTAADCASRDAAVAAYESGATPFKFVKSVYGPKSLKTALAKAQFGKCCFCEGEFDAHVAGDVEHYRPKTSVQLVTGRQYPGYYWLAYTPENLYFACPDCNEYRKSDRFPLLDEGVRARSHHQLIAAEHPLILDPGGPVDPRDHIRFANDFPVGLTDEGRETIRQLKLDREPLNKRRRTLIHRLDGERDVIKLWANDHRAEAQQRVQAARQVLADAILPQAEFSATARDYLAGWTPP